MAQSQAQRKRGDSYTGLGPLAIEADRIAKRLDGESDLHEEVAALAAHIAKAAARADKVLRRTWTVALIALGVAASAIVQLVVA